MGAFIVEVPLSRCWLNGRLDDQRPVGGDVPDSAVTESRYAACVGSRSSRASYDCKLGGLSCETSALTVKTSRAHSGRDIASETHAPNTLFP